MIYLHAHDISIHAHDALSRYASLLLLFLMPCQIYFYILMSHIGQEFFQHILGGQSHAGSVDAGMTSDVFLFQHILIYHQLHMMLCVVQKSHDADAARCDIQILLHVFLRSEA